MTPARGASSTSSAVTLVVVIVLSIASLFPPTCLKDYQELVKLADFGIHEFLTTSLMSSSSSSLASSPWSNASLWFSAGQITPPNRTAVVDVGWEAQREHGYPLEPVSAVLPRRLFLIYGLESSGTTFTARTIAQALGIDPEKKGDFMETKGNQDHVHHISLPWGWVGRGKYGFETQFSVPLPMVPVMYPKQCQMKPTPGRNPPSLKPPPSKACEEIMGDKVMTRPHRFFVNMTTNIQWYRERGVRVYPIMVVRDPMLHLQGIVKKKGGHVPNNQAAYQQYEQGRAIMVETVEKGLKPIIVSYETMLTIQKPYLQQLYAQLGIKSNFFPSFRNGNTKYLSLPGKPHPYVELELMKEDAPPPKQKIFLANNFRPPNRLDQRPRGTTNRRGQPRTSQQTGAHARPNRQEIADRTRSMQNGDMHKQQQQQPLEELDITRKESIRNMERYRDAMQQLQDKRAALARAQRERTAQRSDGSRS